MTDSLKFGPEWLRNLAGDGCSGGGGPSLTAPRCQLAEHRYGREEMLALFDRTCKPPELLTGFSGIFVPKTQFPLALIQMTEEETRLWNGGVSATTGRGRGGSVDRGGRARTGRTGPHYRGVSFDEIGDGPRIETAPFPTRTRAFDRPPNERSWSERNGDSVEWNGSTSPRKELSRGVSGSSLMESNWRRHRGGGEDDDGWRTNARGEKWVKGSWRDDKDRADGDDDKRGERWDHKGGNRAFDPHPPLMRRNRSNHHDSHDLPEWATENPSESGGSFDASGAFHGQYSDDDEDHPDRPHHESKRLPRLRRVSEGNTPHSKNGPKVGPSVVRGPKGGERTLNGERPKSLHASEKDFDKETRRSLSPINSPPSSPIAKKPPASAPGGGQSAAGAGESKKKEKQAKQAQDKKEPPPTNTNAPTSKAKLKVEAPKKAEESKSKTDRSKASEKAENTNKPDARRVPQPAETKAPKITHSQQQQQQQKQQLQHQQQNHHQQQQHPSQQQQHPRQQSTPQQAQSVAASISEQQAEDKQKSESDHLRIEEEVAKLIEGGVRDEKPPGVMSSASVVNSAVLNSAANVVQASSIVHEKWYYRDPQGEVQGPFLANEMAEWHKQGYFAPNLLVRRTCDERYTTLGDLVNLCGTVPFKPGTSFPPLKMSDSLMSPGVSGGVAAGLPVGAGLPKPSGLEDPLMMYQYQQFRLMQNQQLLVKQLRANAINKLSQSDQWASLNPMEQTQLVIQYMRSTNPELTEIALAQSQQPVVPCMMPTLSQQTPPPPSNSVLQLFPQLHQMAKTQSETAHVPQQNPHSVAQPQMSTPIDPIQQLMQQMSNMRNLPPMPQPTIAPTPPQPQPQPPPQDDNPIKTWLRQLAVNSNGHVQQPQPPPQMDSVWHQPPPQLTNTFNAQNWMSQVGAIQPTLPPGQMPGSLWDIHPKEMKTEQQILEEQNLKMQEEKKKEELRKKEELERQQAEERAKRQQEEELTRLKAAEEAAKREEAERKKREEEKRRREEEKRRQEEEQRKLEEKRRKEEEKKREEKRKHDEEVNRKKQEEEKKKRDELKRQEEKARREEEKRKKAEEEQKRQEDERLRKEEEARKKVEAEEQARKAEQRRREAEALRKLQERSKAPWAQAPPPPPPTAQASLAEIQRLEREKKSEDLRLQQLLQQQQLAQQKAAEAAQEALTDSAKRLQFKWAEKAAPANNPASQVKSLAQIQQEEQERVAKVKQQERERQEKEKASQKEATVTLQNVSIWGAASQSLNWSSTSNSASGFWDDPTPKANAAPAKTATTPKQAPKQQVVKSPVQQQQQQQQQLQQQQQQQQLLLQQQQQQQQLQQLQQQQNNIKAAKSKNKKEEELVKKLFEQNTAKTDDFTQWCNKALSGLQVSVDIPTFIGFLRDIEAAYEVKEYVRMYLGDGKQCAEFAKQFLEKRSKWKSAQRPQTQADDLCKPAPAVNPNASTEFQEVKSKSKKPKKGKMFKVDSKMLGFSVMSAPDRINVGDRDYAEGV